MCFSDLLASGKCLKLVEILDKNLPNLLPIRGHSEIVLAQICPNFHGSNTVKVGAILPSSWRPKSEDIGGRFSPKLLKFS